EQKDTPYQAEPEELPAPEPPPVPDYEHLPQPTAPAGFLTGIPLPQGSLWRTIGKGVLITFGLAILIRALSGDD
ncbi:MAG: hypothetical protein ACYC6L_10085, partial [Anaerolineae bacterium]